MGRKSPQDHRGVSFIPRPTGCSLASSSGPPFYLLIKAPRYGYPDRRWFCCYSAFINGSLCHVCLSPCTIMNTWAYIGVVPTKACLVQSGRSSETAPTSIVFIRICLCFTWLCGDYQAIRPSGRLLFYSGWTTSLLSKEVHTHELSG